MLYMAIEKVLYAVRIPVDLKRLIDSAARSGGVNTSQLVIDALWKYLGGAAQPDRAPAEVRKADGSIPSPLIKTPDVKMNDAMSAFLAKAKPVITPDPVSETQEHPMPSCRECDTTMSGKLIKGRGMVYACTDLSCPMYGLERR